MKESEAREAAFMGRMTAGVTHELKNVLAIIRESAGLMQDLLALSTDAPQPLKEKFSKVLSNIGDQVVRGVDLATRLNTFAHLPDDITKGLDLNEVADQVVFLSKRFARLKRISLAVAPRERPVIVVTDPLKIQMLLVTCVEMLSTITAAGATITLRTFQQRESEATVEFSWSGSNERGSDQGLDLSDLPQWVELRESAGALKGRIEPGKPPVWFSITFGRADG